MARRLHGAVTALDYGIVPSAGIERESRIRIFDRGGGVLGAQGGGKLGDPGEKRLVNRVSSCCKGPRGGKESGPHKLIGWKEGL